VDFKSLRQHLDRWLRFAEKLKKPQADTVRG
jgi:hypothetical protein